MSDDDTEPFKPGGVVPPPVMLDPNAGTRIEFVRLAHATELLAEAHRNGWVLVDPTR